MGNPTLPYSKNLPLTIYNGSTSLDEIVHNSISIGHNAASSSTGSISIGSSASGLYSHAEGVSGPIGHNHTEGYSTHSEGSSAVGRMGYAFQTPGVFASESDLSVSSSNSAHDLMGQYMNTKVSNSRTFNASDK